MVNSSLSFELLLAHTERAINHALQYSLEWPEQANVFEGKLIYCELDHLKMKVWVRFENGIVSLVSTPSLTKEDLAIRATPSALLDMLQTKRANSNIHISGDAHLAQALQQVMGTLNIDWEGLLADQMGELGARQASTLFNKVKGFTQRFTKNFIADTADYLVDERALLPSQPEVEGFYKEVRSLRYETDQLEARLRKLEGR